MISERQVRVMLKQMTITAGVALAVLSIFLLGAQVLGPRSANPLIESSNADFQRTVTVTGEADINVKPDSLQAEIGVVSLREKLQEAITENNEKMAAVIAALKELGIAEKDIQTVRFDVQPERTDYNGPIVRYRVSNELHVTIRDLSRAADILDRAIQSGANDLSGIRFAASNLEQLEQQARKEAITDAMSKARQMVEAAGGKLGQVLTISTASYNPPMYDRSVLFGAADVKGVPVEPGELQLKVSVQVVYAIE